MSKALMESTQIVFTMTVQVDTDRETEILYLLMLLLTPVRYVYQLWHTFNSLRVEFRLWLLDMSDMVSFIWKVMVITVKSFAYGLGMMR